MAQINLRIDRSEGVGGKESKWGFTVNHWPFGCDFRILGSWILCSHPRADDLQMRVSSVKCTHTHHELVVKEIEFDSNQAILGRGV